MGGWRGLRRGTPKEDVHEDPDLSGDPDRNDVRPLSVPKTPCPLGDQTTRSWGWESSYENLAPALDSVKPRLRLGWGWNTDRWE